MTAELAPSCKTLIMPRLSLAEGTSAMTAKVRIEGQTATIGRAISRRKRASALAGGLGLVITAVGVLAYSPSPQSWLAILGGLMLMVATILLIVVLAPDREFVFNAGARNVTIRRQYPWQSRGKVTQVAFSDICSLGVDRVRNDEGSDTYNAVLRLEIGTLTLWSLEDAGQDTAQLLASNPDLVALHELTGLRYEHRD